MPATFVNAAYGIVTGYPNSPQTLISGYDLGSGSNRGVFAHMMTQSGGANAAPTLLINGVTIPRHQWTATAATKDNPGQITATGHGLRSNSQIRFVSVAGGMTELVGTWYTITAVDANNFTIGADTSGFTGTFTTGLYEARNLNSADDYEEFFHLEGGTVPSGVQNVTATFTNASISVMEVVVVTYSSEASLANLGWTANLAGITAGNPVTRTVSSTTGDLAIWIGCHQPNGVTLTSYGGTKRFEQAGNAYQFFVLEEPGAASVTVDYTCSGGTVYPQGVYFSLVTGGGGGTKKLKLLTTSSAVGQTVDGIVWNTASGTDVGSKVGTFTSQTIAAGTGGDTGFGVLKVDATAFGGSGLADGTTVKVYAQNSTNFTPHWDGTIITE